MTSASHTDYARNALLVVRGLRPNSVEGGFSLLEMVVVLAIIGILVAIQLPNVIGNTDKAKFVAAQTQISNAVTECATAKTNGASEAELVYRSAKFLDAVPSMATDPSGYQWARSASFGCSYMMIQPIDSDGNRANNLGWPILYAKIASGGRIVKAADLCRPYGSLDFTKECKRWDHSMDDTTFRTNRNLRDPNWALNEPEPDPVPAS